MDPRSVCRGIVSAVGEKESLPEEVPESLKLLFEEWLDELTEEARRITAQRAPLSTPELAKYLRISKEGAEYIRERLKRIS
ncbi:hypothetical protein [Thermosulfurimonas dismutans]|uniref:Uncharacterized protein n=1 Tax=Thermosulfurimonas dismutans TaxID=999894 RepID=A0A179D6B9_9BACT|nr:hypothetical protein [Thermosulfurimonas dismutans]OAQ21650.1 hypothetical protein TDIS_0168 [Thermosulfurimonas dismutans]